MDGHCHLDIELPADVQPRSLSDVYAIGAVDVRLKLLSCDSFAEFPNAKSRVFRANRARRVVRKTRLEVLATATSVQPTVATNQLAIAPSWLKRVGRALLMLPNQSSFRRFPQGPLFLSFSLTTLLKVLRFILRCVRIVLSMNRDLFAANGRDN